ncbi:MAG: type II CAAX endopeptidase family protein, partial [Planctomycetota bacterium]|nr:type II CAAX endopeptidase family protein [Planctomycetota bacterium]
LTMARAFEYSLVQLFPWFTLFPLTWQALAALGQQWAPAVAAGATVATTFLTGALRLWGETQLRLRCSLHTIKNVQGVATILSLLGFGLLFWVALSRSTPHGFLDFAASTPAGLLFLPGSWPIAIGPYGLPAVAAGVASSALVFGFSVSASANALKGGAMRTGGVDAGARGEQRSWAGGAGMGIGGKEVALLKRDRTFLVQTILVPIFIIGIQLVVNPKLGDADGPAVAIIAYVVGFYGALGGCFQVLSSEGRALWMLYSLPVSTLEILRRKAAIWARLCCGLGVAALVVFSVRADASPLTFVEDLGFVTLGVWCSAHVAAAISVLGANTTPDSVQRQPKQRYIWLYMFLAGSYCAVLGLADLGPRIAGATIYATIAYALWLRSAERMRWLLDPVTDPRDELSLLDAAAALLTFFLLQVVSALILGLYVEGQMWAQALAFVIAGSVAVAFYGLRLRARQVPTAAAFGLGGGGAAGYAAGAVGGAVLGLAGLLYANAVREAAPELIPDAPADGFFALLMLAVVAAPFVEELLFRGLLLGALRRVVSDRAAVVWSSLLFAFVHPMVSWPPVFLLGLACALLRCRGAPVFACMLLHAVYNAIVVGLA